MWDLLKRIWDSFTCEEPENFDLLNEYVKQISKKDEK